MLEKQDQPKPKYGYRIASYNARLIGFLFPRPPGVTPRNKSANIRDRRFSESYQKNHAPALIQEGIDKFGQYLTSDRRIMMLLN